MSFLDSIVNLLSPRPKYATRRIPPAPPKHPRMSEDDHNRRESELRKQATALKKQKRYDEAVRFLRLAREEQYKTSFWYDIDCLLRIPKYLILAGRYNDAISEAKEILSGKWNVCGQDTAEGRTFIRQAILDVIAEAAEKSGDSSLVSFCEKNASEYNSKIAKARFEDVRRECLSLVDGNDHDLVRISSYCGGVPTDPCFVWHGRIISAFGKVRGFPTLDDVDAKALFGGEVGHNVEAVIECIDKDEIALFKAHPLRDFSFPSLLRNKNEIDVDRFVRRGKSRSASVVAVARERLEIAIRAGLICEESQQIVNALSDKQVFELCPDGIPPVFEPFKATKKEIANGARESYENGVLTISRQSVSASRIVEIFQLAKVGQLKIGKE